MSTKKNEEVVDSLSEIKKLPCEPSKVKEGDLMFFIYPGKVKSKKNNGNDLEISWLDKPSGFEVHGAELVANAYSADQFSEEKKVNQTECIDRLMVSFNKPFKVCFDKQNEEERVLRGRLVNTDPKRGYSLVEDLDLEGPSYKRFRQVDHRSLKWLIVDGIKFVVGRK